MTIKGGTTPACAACKYQRRRCTPNCPLAPYFPANNPKMFRNVHRLFGVSNVTKTLISLKSKEEQDEAMKSIVYEADMRERFPVHGCCAVIQLLRLQFQYAVEELQHVRAHLAACREQQQLNSNNINNNEIHYENGMNYGINQFLSNENVSLFVDNLLSENTNLAAIQAQMDALGMKEQETNLFPSDLERMQFGTRNIDDRQPYNIDQTRETLESRHKNEADSCGAASKVTQRTPWL